MRTGIAAGLISLFLILGWPIARPVRAADGPPPEIADKIELCATCHGADGHPVKQADPSIVPPNIWGQEFYYLYVQLRDFQAGRRESNIMQPVVADLTKQQNPRLPSISPASLGRCLASRRTKPTLAPRRASLWPVNAPNAISVVTSAIAGDPRMAGQSQAYLEKDLLDFKYNRRKNAPDTANIVRTFSEEELKAMSDYLAGLQINLPPCAPRYSN